MDLIPFIESSRIGTMKRTKYKMQNDRLIITLIMKELNLLIKVKIYTDKKNQDWLKLFFGDTSKHKIIKMVKIWAKGYHDKSNK